LIRVGVRAHRDVLALPRRPRQLDAQHLRSVDLDDDLALEVAAGVEVEVGVRWAGEAVKATMTAAPVGIDRPPEWHPRPVRHAVERGFGSDFVETGVQRLGRVEVADDGRLAVAGERGLLFGGDREVVPAHERMFAQSVDGPRRCGSGGQS
jgi:hypothetical protein